MYEQVFQGTKLCKPPLVNSYQLDWRSLAYNYEWDGFLGIASYAGSAYNYTYRIFLDGTAMKYGNLPYVYSYPKARVGGTICWTYGGFSPDTVVNPGETMTALAKSSENLNTTGMSMPDYYAILLVDEKNQVYVAGTSVSVKTYSLNDGSLLGTATHNRGAANSVSWVKNGVLALFEYSTGRVTFIDYLYTNKVIGIGRIAAGCKMAAYDCTNNVIFAIDANYNTQVYTLDAWPALLSIPIFDSTPVYAVQANKVKVQLTGDDGEACPDWWVHWILDDLAVGSLQTERSKTDSDGYAENVFFGPVDNVAASNTLHASVVLY